MSLYRRPRAEVEIGDADGKIALFLNEKSAYDLAAMFTYPDRAGAEIMEAIKVAYPEPFKDAALDEDTP